MLPTEYIIHNGFVQIFKNPGILYICFSYIYILILGSNCIVGEIVTLDFLSFLWQVRQVAAHILGYGLTVDQISIRPATSFLNPNGKLIFVPQLPQSTQQNLTYHTISHRILYFIKGYFVMLNIITDW